MDEAIQNWFHCQFECNLVVVRLLLFGCSKKHCLLVCWSLCLAIVLESLVEKNLFREDLYYRLNVFKIELPALKDRRIDLPILIRHILRRLCTASDNRLARISEEAMELLLKFHYPGNVRELENILEHALIICRDDVIRPKHLPDYMQHLDTASEPENLSSPTTGGETDNAERQHILKVLRQNNWQRSKTAQVLEMDRTTLWRKMKRHGINR